MVEKLGVEIFFPRLLLLRPLVMIDGEEDAAVFFAGGADVDG